MVIYKNHETGAVIHFELYWPQGCPAHSFTTERNMLESKAIWDRRIVSLPLGDYYVRVTLDKQNVLQNIQITEIKNNPLTN